MDLEGNLVSLLVKCSHGYLNYAEVGGLGVLEDGGLQKMTHLKCNLVIVGKERV